MSFVDGHLGRAEEVGNLLNSIADFDTLLVGDVVVVAAIQQLQEDVTSRTPAEETRTAHTLIRKAQANVTNTL